MTVSTTPYFSWGSSGINSLTPPYEACSANLISLMNFCRAELGGTSLGCHVQRAVSGGSTLSSHAYGAALDVRFHDRAATIGVMDWLINNSAELGVNTIHDYVTQRMWKPNVGWRAASIGSVGGTWIHVETTPAAFRDGRPVQDKLAGTVDEVDPDPTPAEVAAATWG